MKKKLLIALIMILCHSAKSQCLPGEVEVTLTVYTDDWGYEGYWQIVPTGNTCGIGTIASGGNNLVGCNGGGAQSVTSGGYPNMATISEGPWCLTQGASFDLIFVDDYGDGGSSFTISINGLPVYSGLSGTGNGSGTRFTFVAQGPPSLDLACEKIISPVYVNIGNVDVAGTFMNRGSDTITNMTINYSIDNGVVNNASLTGLNIFPFTNYSVIHPTQWQTLSNGAYSVKMWASDINGSVDSNMVNDTATKIINVGPPTPNYIDEYIGSTPVLTVIGNSSNGVLIPRDLDFHPILTRNELWVVLKSTEASGGKTVKFSNAGLPGQTSLLQQDGNAYHFMSLPTGIAFSDNENFCTSPGVYDANHDGGAPFTGPALWSSDPSIYAQPSGGNGSHIDMLHQSPYSMGVCSERDNAFWIFDGNANEIVRYDFASDHGPGNSDHSDGIIRRFSGLGLMADPNHNVPSHIILDKETGILYIVDTGNDRILRMDINTGSFTNNLTPYEPVSEYSTWGGASFNLFADSALTTPSGIDFIGNRLIVSDYATGDIIIYDKSNVTGIELGRISTGTPGIMGVKIGPDGKIWYVNATTNQVVRIDGITAGISESKMPRNINLFPNPASSDFTITSNSLLNDCSIKIYDAAGKLVKEIQGANSQSIIVSINNFASGIYTVQLVTNSEIITKKLIKQ